MELKVKSEEKLLRAQEKVIKDFEKKLRKDKSLGTGLLLVHSDALNIHLKASAHHDPEVQSHADQPFHIASIGKTFTSVIIAMLQEQGKIDFEDLISIHLPREAMQGLHVYKGRDYSGAIRIRHLLNHTSGLADYFMDKNFEGTRLMDLMISEPDRYWTPIETLEWTKKQLIPKFPPGKGFHYSDANYALLGLIIEKVTSLKYHGALSEFIFKPLGMKNSWLILHSEPEVLPDLHLGEFLHDGTDLYKAKSISMSWASGGIVSTLEDMLKFMQALVKHELIGMDTREKMNNWAKMGFNLQYGYGIMKFSFPGMSKKYDIWGHSGSIGTVCYYNQSMDLYTIATFHKVGYQVQPVIFLVKILRKFRKALRFR